MADLIRVALPNAGPGFGQAKRRFEEAVRGSEAISTMGIATKYLGVHEAGTNPEFDRPLGIFQHHLELMQAMLLRGGTAKSGGAPWHDLVEITEAARGYTDAWLLLQAQKIERAATGEHRSREELLYKLRLRAGLLRGWAYQDRMFDLLVRLLEPLGEAARNALGFELASVVRWWAAMLDLVNSRISRSRAAVLEAFGWPVDDRWISRLEEQFGTFGDRTKWTILASENAALRRLYVRQCSDLSAHELYRFGSEDLVGLFPEQVAPEALRRVVDSWSMSSGEDGDVNLQHLIIENPVVSRPFVKSAPDSWHLFCGWLLLHNPFELIETILEGHEVLVDAYLARRADFLEEEVARLLATALPGATIERSLVSVDPTDGREYENDVVALVSSFAVVAEAKAGRLHPDARRGHSRVLRDRVDELLVRPSKQGRRLAQRLEQTSGSLNLARRGDRSEVTIDASSVRRSFAIGVTLEPLASLLPRLVEIDEAGLTGAEAGALAYSINLPDLELVVELLEHPSEVLHYLTRRGEIEQLAFLSGDEVDLLALYLETGFNLGEREFTGDVHLDVTGLSNAIDVWHYRQDAGMPAEKPQPLRTPWWEAVLTRVEQRAGPRWAEIGFTLCNVAPPEQDEFEQAMHSLRRAIATGEREMSDVLSFENGPPQRRNFFAGIIVDSASRETRRRQYENAIATILETDGVEGLIILLAWPPRPSEAPYAALMAYDPVENGPGS